MFSPIRLPFLLALILFLATGCGQSKPAASTPQPPKPPPRQSAPPAQQEPAVPQKNAPGTNDTCRDEQAIQESERNRAACFQLRPGVTTTKVVKIPVKTAKATKSSTKKGQKTTSKKAAIQKTKVEQTTGRCQPQSLIYARCRTGFMTCKLGDTSPVQWFACAKKNNSTSATPVTGSVIVLDVNSRRGMPTGHPAYVEAAEKNQNGTWTLRISHTNYDRKCHLDLDATVLFDPKRMTASFTTGPWGPWAKELKALGFILR